MAFNKKLPMTAIIAQVSQSAARQGRVWLEPKDFANEIRKSLPKTKSEYVSAIVWRMWKSGRMHKHPEESRYTLLENVKASDLQTLASTGSEALNRVPEAQGVKAAPGGST